MNQFNEFDQNSFNQKVPNDSTVLTLGIVAIVCSILGCCCGLFTVVPGLIVSIVGLIMANKGLATYRANPGLYAQTSYKNLNTGKILSIIALIINIIILLITILYFVGVFTYPDFMQEYLDKIEEMQDL